MDLASGDFAMQMINPNPEEGDLQIRDFEIQFLPRMADLETMIDTSTILDVRGNPITAHSNCSPRKNFELSDNRSFRLARLSDERFVDITYDSTGCEPGAVVGPNDIRGGEIIYCPHGTALSLFPSTTVYVTATIIDPNARHFDPEVGEMVEGPLETKVFYQFAGIVPDFNDNGIDDLIDIREGASEDENGNGVPEPISGSCPPSNWPWWLC